MLLCCNFFLLCYFFSIRPPPELLPVLGPLERYMTPTFDTARLCSSRAGFDLGCKSDWFEEHLVTNENMVLCLYMPKAGFDPLRAESGNCV